MAKHDMSDLNFSQIAKQQGVSRAAVAHRAARGWSREELLLGRRLPEQDEPRRLYRSTYSDKLGGFTAREVAKHNNLSVPGMYYRLQNNMNFELPPKKED